MREAMPEVATVLAPRFGALGVWPESVPEFTFASALPWELELHY